MIQMRYEAAKSPEEASLLLALPVDTRALAGGTDLLVQLRSEAINPRIVVDLKRIDGMLDIRDEDGGFRIGACVPASALTRHDRLPRLWPGVAEAAGLIGSAQIQNRATLAGNLCNASPAADSVPALIAAKATVRVIGSGGECRDLAAESVATGPGRTCLRRAEFVSSIFLPPRPPRAADAYLRFTPRTEMDIAVVGAAVSVALDESGTCISARVSLGAVAPTAIIVDAAADLLVGSKGDPATLERLAAVCTDAARPIADKRGTVAFRKHIAGVLARRAAAVAFQRAETAS